MTPVAVDRQTLERAKLATFAFFGLAGVAFASWASRIADAKNELGLGAGELGATLFARSVGSVPGGVTPTPGRGASMRKGCDAFTGGPAWGVGVVVEGAGAGAEAAGAAAGA